MLPRMRTIGETIRLLREQDPDTCLTETALRRMVITGEIPSVRVGKKYLICLDAIEAHLRGVTHTQAQDYSVRKIQS